MKERFEISGNQFQDCNGITFKKVIVSGNASAHNITANESVKTYGNSKVTNVTTPDLDASGNSTARNVNATDSLTASGNSTIYNSKTVITKDLSASGNSTVNNVTATDSLTASGNSTIKTFECATATIYGNTTLYNGKITDHTTASGNMTAEKVTFKTLNATPANMTLRSCTIYGDVFAYFKEVTNTSTSVSVSSNGICVSASNIIGNNISIINGEVYVDGVRIDNTRASTQKPKFSLTGDIIIYGALHIHPDIKLSLGAEASILGGIEEDTSLC